MKKFIILLFSIGLIFNLFLTDTHAAGNTLESVDINVFLNPDGSAVIRETRVGNYSEGTENYNVIENLGQSQITDFSVTEDGRRYEFKEPWDIDDSREEKTFKNGIINTSNGYELAWGIGDYGRHTYELEYTVTNFVKELTDSQMVFWRFINDNTNIPPKSVTVTIEADTPLNAEQEKVWGFGFEGNVEFIDGRVFAKSSEPLDQSNYVTILLKLPMGMFSTGDILDKSFDEIENRAFEGSDYGESTGNNFKSSFPKFGYVFAFLGFFFPILFLIIFASIFTSMSGRIIKPFKRKYLDQYYRDYPYEGRILDIYYILHQMGLSNFTNILTGFFLKWINEGRLETYSEEEGFIIKKDKTQTRILDRSLPEDHNEGELYNMLLRASRGDDILQEKEFVRWARSNYTEIDAWEKRVKEESIRELSARGYVRVEQKKKFFIKFKNTVLTEKGLDVEKRIYKYINYLYDYSLINEHEAVNVKLWDKIMIWAGFLGAAEVVAKQFEKIYPQYTEESVYRGNSIYLAHSLTQNVSSARSSGAGGSTSSGGGGGSFGGGSGGGTR